MTHTYIGVDLSKDWLDIYHPDTGFDRVRNQKTAVRRWLKNRAPEDFVVFEATSGCDTALYRLASALGLNFARVNPGHSFFYSRSLNLPKTDRVDARMLARFGKERQLEASAPFDPERAELGELEDRRVQLKDAQKQEKNRLSKASTETVCRMLQRALRFLAQELSEVEAQIKAFLAAHPRLARAAELLQSIPSIGPVTAVRLLASMPELGHLDRRGAGSLAGLAPRARESGKWKGTRSIGAGRRHVRRALYMAALSAIRHDQVDPAFIARKREEGKAGKVIIIAMARKMITIANAVLRDQRPYQAMA